MAYHWNDEPGEIARLGALADAVEIAGCRDLGDSIERADGDAADLWSVYFHFPDTNSPASGQLVGVLCVGDRDTRSAAVARGEALGRRFSIPVHDFT